MCTAARIARNQKIYDNLDNKTVKVWRHGHDRNASVSKFIREKRTATVNQNDTWHVLVSVEKEMKKIATGVKCREGKTWSVQLSDKIQSVKTHVNYSVRNCDGNPSKLMSNLENITDHYRNNHEKCSSESRCQTDPNYLPCREILTDSVAIWLLSEACDVYKNAEMYVYHIDTFFVEHVS